MVDSWNPAVLNETTQTIDSWNPAELNQVTTKVDSWNPAILNKNLESSEPPVVFSATITASFPEGATCTATDGTTTLTADDNPMAFSIPNEGTWAVACVANGVTFSEDVVITTSGQTETIDLTPVGDTYTTTDSVPVLIACAGIGDSEITTIAGALADVETLTAILESENAVDYLVRSTTFASDVTADSVAMTGIGSINYDADTLLADSTWLAAICDSAYFESVLNLKVPTMTSNTTPSGECFGVGEHATEKAYKAFDGNDTTYTQLAVSGTDYNVGYKSTASRTTYLGTCLMGADFTLTLQYSDDNETWTDASTSITTTSQQVYKMVSSETAEHQYWRIKTTSVTNKLHVIYTIQFYGRQDVE